MNIVKVLVRTRATSVVGAIAGHYIPHGVLHRRIMAQPTSVAGIIEVMPHPPVPVQRSIPSVIVDMRRVP